ncbi:hypothetical protein [Blautia fusiformis]|uniref:DUF5348 domain-containing protein n=1 Tax=Blautia fusiformis TaxID=2881264 RepID=A0AAW4WBE2_9FIRM|nr:hypothetical protein [Blautia fusiformis]MCC2228459.1 hypothetical protein [Blautia fusiformis]
MEKLKLYTVTKGSTDGTIEMGNIIWISENGDLNIAGRKGFLIHDEWDNPDTKDFKVKPCEDYYLEVANGHEIVRKR